MFRAIVGSLAVLGVLGGSVRAQVKLEYKFVEGSSTSSKSTTKTHQILTIMGQDIETTAEESVGATQLVGKRAADGTLPITQSIDSIKTMISLPGGAEVRFDSANPGDAKNDLPQLAFLSDLFKAVVGSSYTIVLDAKNKVKAIEGADKILEKVKDKGEQVIDALKSRSDAEKLKKAFDEAHNNMPNILVREGEPWDRTDTRDIGGGQTLTFKNRYEYLGTVNKAGKMLDKLGVRSTGVTLTMDPDSKSPAKIVSSDLKVESSDSTILFDRAAGIIVDRTSKVQIKGDITLEANGQQLPAKLDLTIDSNTTQSANAK
jgi:hypothetical protein